MCLVEMPRPFQYAGWKPPLTNCEGGIERDRRAIVHATAMGANHF